MPGRGATVIAAPANKISLSHLAAVTLSLIVARREVTVFANPTKAASRSAYLKKTRKFAPTGLKLNRENG
jgi:hypothetical protein